MSEFNEKYEELSNQKKQEVIDFVEFLWLKEKNNEKVVNEKFKEKILNTPNFSENDINLIEEAQQNMKQWTFPKW